MTRFPLSWPEGWPRTPAAKRKRARFSKGERQYSNTPGGGSWIRHREVSISDATQRIVREVQTFGVREDDAIISTNLELRLDGLPRSGQRAPDDPGAAVYWTRRGDKGTKVMAIDIYDRVADNLAAIAATLDAMRAIERHGGAQILERAFTGFTALPAPGRLRAWWEVLGVGPDLRDFARVKAAYRQLASQAHPDREGGSHTAMSELNAALAQAERICGGANT